MLIATLGRAYQIQVAGRYVSSASWMAAQLEGETVRVASWFAPKTVLPKLR